MTTAATALVDHARALYNQQQTLTRSSNERRAALPPEPVANGYTFTRTEGTTASLADLFLDHHDLLVIHNMGRQCAYCTMWADAFIGLTRHITRRAALVLASPFSELCRAAEARMPWVPACALLWDERWDNAARIRAVDAPILVIHGDRDAVIPAAEGRRLAEIADARFLLYEDTGHLLPRGRLTADIDAFLARAP